MKKTLNLAHRGFSGNYPENSPIAFEAAINVEGCDGFESDVHLTKDNEPVIIHDTVLERTTNGRGAVIDHTYKELKELDCGGWHSPKFTGQKIMHLDDLFALVLEHKLYLNLEVKNYDVFYKDIEEIVITRIKKLKAEDSVILSSFNHYSMLICKQVDPSIKTGFLYHYTHAKAEEYAKANNMDAIHPRFQSIWFDQSLVKRSHDKGIQVNSWTLNTPEQMRSGLSFGLDAIITNYPDQLATVMKNWKEG